MYRRARSNPIGTVFMAASMLIAIGVVAAGCGGPQPPAGPQRAKIGAFSATLETEPSPPVSKQETIFKLKVADDQGQPVTDAGVAVSLTMPGMNHGKNVIELSHQGAGVYEGNGIFVMAGRWVADVTVSRGGQEAKGRFMLQLPR